MKIGTRVQIHPAHDAWMQGDRYGTVTGYGRRREYVDSMTGNIETAIPLRVKLDKSGRILRFHPEAVYAID